MKTLWLAAAAAGVLATAAQAADTGPDLTQTPRMGPWGFDLAGRGAGAKAGAGLYEYANGGYIARLQIPADRSRYGAFDALSELSTNRMRAVLDKAAANPAAAGPEAQIATLYRAYMDEGRIEALGAKPLAPDLARIKAAASHADIARLMGAAQGKLGGSAFAAVVNDDAKDPEHYTVYLYQAGLGLPDRDYYLETSFAAQRAGYQAYVAQMLKLAGWADPDGSAQAILALETEIAKVSWTRAERRDDDKTYNPFTVGELAAYAPGFPWAAYMDGAGLTKATKVVAAENTAFPKIAAIVAKTPVATLQAWQAFQLADQAAPYLSKAFDEAHFEFRDKLLSGQPQQKPRWKRGVALVDQLLGEALGQIYVAAYFPPENKAKMEVLVADVTAAMGTRIQNLAWMGPATKAKAADKLAKFRVKIAYPDKWRDYSSILLKDDDLYGDVQRAAAFDWNFRVARLGGPVDDEEWGMTPPTINAYYTATKNEILFPAAILAPPFFDAQGDPAINYGAIGGVIGHEITHGFDDQGRKSDGDGKLTDWWTAEDAAKFQVQADKLGKQYAAIEVLPGAHIKGDLTMGENIADLGGLLLALDAYHLSLKGKPAPVIDGLTGDERVFMGWAQVWRAKVREDRARQLLVVDPHSPPRYRVDVPVRNIDAFYEAFGVKPGDKMYVAPAERVRIW